MILLIDNYDSFTFNLFQYLGELGREIKVVRNDQIVLEEIQNMNLESIVLSPGPGRPKNAGICLSLIQKFSGTLPILGICLGHQSIGQAFGGEIVYAPDLMHGKSSMIHHYNQGLYEGLPSKLEVGRYHSLVVNKASLPDCLQITSWTDEGVVMGFRHKTHSTEGIQFHPESILTPRGKDILANFLKSVDESLKTKK